MPNRQKTDEKIQYLVRGHEEFVIEIPAAWRLTFGYVNPAHPEGGYRNQPAHCLRVYEGEKLRAVFASVSSFRDLSIPLARKFQKETGAAEWSQDSEGNFERSEKRLVEKAFVPSEELNGDAF
jgi:hypothetical protein